MHEIDDSSHVDTILARAPRIVEVSMVVVAVLVTLLLLALPQHWHAVLYLSFLPVALSGFYLGRYRSGVMAFLCVVAVAVATGISNELQQMFEVADALAVGVWGAVLGLTSILTGTVSDERKRHLKQLSESHRQDTLKDALTEVANRRALDNELRRRSAELERKHTPFALVFIDIDHFKRFNDRYGHQAGDAVLRGVAQTLDEITREMDLVARYGGEEFAIVLPNSSVREAKDAAERARRKIEAHCFTFQGVRRMKITISVGLAQAIESECVAFLVKRADTALYSSKQSGRNCSTFHNGESCEPFGKSLSRVAVEESINLVVDSSPVDAYWDRETNLPGRRIFIDDLRRQIAVAQRHKTDLSIVLVEIDDFHDLHNDAPDVARNVIAVIAELTRAAMRDADMVARYSLNQLAVSMPLTPLDGASIAADRVRTWIRECQAVNDKAISIRTGVRFGIAEIQPNEEAVPLLERAQLAIGADADVFGFCSDDERNPI